jgi:hypothetical protein
VENAVKKTEMELSSEDIKRLEEADYRLEEFAVIVIVR